MSAEISTLDLALARRERDLRLRQNALRRQNELEFFQPHVKQNCFYGAAIHHYRYARTGNRFGKSEMGAAEDVAFALGFRPWIPEGNPLRTLGIPPHPTKGLIVTTDWDKSTEVFTAQTPGDEKTGVKDSNGIQVSLGKLFKYIPTSRLGQCTRNHSGAIDRILVRHTSGGWSSIHLDTVKSYKQNPLGQESSVWDWVHIDEPIPEGMWHAIARGLIDRDGRAWFTCTPLTEPWIDTLFIPDLQDQSRDTTNVQHGDFWMMTGTTDDNPHNTLAAIERVMQQYTEEERECRRTGIPAAYAGLVYKEFKWEVHVRRECPSGWPDWYHPPADHTLRFAIDYHPRKPHAVLFIATSPQDRHYVYNEIWRSCLMSELVSDIKTVLHNGESTTPGLIDPLADTPNRVTDITPLEEVLRLGLAVMPATKDPYNGILRVKEILTARDRTNQPTLLFNSALTRTLFEISRGYMWDGETNKPVKKDDDMMENFYRLCLQGLDYIEPSDSDSRLILSAPIPQDAMDFTFGPIDLAPVEKTARQAALQRSRYRN